MKIEYDSFVEPIVKKIQNKLYPNRVYLVGGFVRDTLLKRPSFDLDFTTDKEPDQVHSLFPQSLYFAKYGTTSFKIEDRNITIATLRKEGDYQDFRHPKKVEFVKSVQEDYLRRDFTINALYVDEDGQILDPSSYGLVDIKEKRLRLIGDALTRFKEDPLRILRATRFKYELDFSFDAELLNALNTTIDLISFLNVNKIKEEVSKCPLSMQKKMIEELHLQRFFAL